MFPKGLGGSSGSFWGREGQEEPGEGSGGPREVPRGLLEGIAPQPLMTLLGRRPQNLFSQKVLAHSDGIHSRQLHDFVEVSHPAIIKRSVFGMIRVYSRLPVHVADAKSAKLLQHAPQKLAQEAASAGMPQWQLMFHANA